MYWVLDAIMVLLFAAALLLGYRRGFVNMLATTISVILLVAFTVAGAAGLWVLFYKVGAVNGLGYMLISVFGETNSLFAAIGLESFDVCQMVSAVILLILAFIVSGAIFVAVSWGVKKLCYKIPHKGVFGIITGTLGAAVYAALVLAVFWGVTALFYALAQKGGEFSIQMCEFFESCSISGWLFKINPLNELLAGFIA